MTPAVRVLAILGPTPTGAPGVPVTPDAAEARRWLLDELAKAPYQAAKPTWFDLLAKAVKDWLASLFSPPHGSMAPLLVVALVVVALALIVVAFVVFGLPRLNRRSTLLGELFGEADRRDADDLRRAAERAAASENWTLAIEELFRALARGLAERTILTVHPGTTARGFAARAARVFADERDELADAATVFDRVRYLGGTGSPAEYERLAALERAMRSARPALPDIDPTLAAPAGIDPARADPAGIDPAPGNPAKVDGVGAAER